MRPRNIKMTISINQDNAEAPRNRTRHLLKITDRKSKWMCHINAVLTI